MKRIMLSTMAIACYVLSAVFFMLAAPNPGLVLAVAGLYSLVTSLLFSTMAMRIED